MLATIFNITRMNVCASPRLFLRRDKWPPPGLGKESTRQTGRLVKKYLEYARHLHGQKGRNERVPTGKISENSSSILVMIVNNYNRIK